MSAIFRRLAFAIAATAGLANNAIAEGEHIIGSSHVSAPSGWHAVSKSPERIVFRSKDDREQATVSAMRFASRPSFSEFKKLCEHRLTVEKQELIDGFVGPSAPFEDAGRFGMFFSGGDKRSKRLFSGYLSLVKTELITVYVEGLGLPPKQHLASFEAFVRGLKRP